LNRDPLLWPELVHVKGALKTLISTVCSVIVSLFIHADHALRNLVIT